MAKGDKSAVPATPMKSGGTRSEASGCTRSSYSTPTTFSTPITERSESFADSVDYSDAKEDDEGDYLAGVKALARNLAKGYEEVAGPAMYSDDDGSDGAKPSAATGKTTFQPIGFRPPINGNTPGDNKVIGKTLELMMTKSSWMQMFGPTLVCQAVWMNLGGELVVPIDSTSTRQVAQDTVMLLRAMGCEPQRFPSDAALDDWAPADAGTALRKWKKKLRAAFGVEELLQVQNEPSTCVFGSKGSPYMHDSHMVTPMSVSRQDRVVKENEASRSTPNTYNGQAQQPDRRYDLNEDSSDDGRDLLDVDHLEGDLTEEWARQIRELSAKEEKNSTPRIEVTTHLPLGNIKSFSGYRKKSEKSMQWLRTFIHEMKGTHTPPNDWCMAFELSLQDGALHWYRQLPRKTRRTWKLLRDAFIKYYCSKFNQSAKARYYPAKREVKEHVCDYLNRFNGYARCAGVQFENGGREAKDHVEHFLDTCDDRKRLCHVRVRDIHDLEDMINEILKRRDRKSKRDSSVRRHSGQDGSHRRGSSRNEDSRSNYRRDDRRRDESPYRPRITLADALSDLVTALNETSVGPQTNQSGSYDHEYESNEKSFGDGERRDDEDRYSNRGSEYDYAGEDDRGHVAAANDHERRAAADGTFALSDNRRPKGDGHINNDRGFARDNRNPGATSIPLWSCGYLKKSSHVNWGMSGSTRASITNGKYLHTPKGRDDTLLQKKKELYKCWLAEQPPAVERHEYTTPAHILARPTEDSVAPRKYVPGHPESADRGDGVNNHNCVKIYDDSEASVAAGLDEETTGELDTQPTEFSDAEETR
ncbi:hypothetical protein PHMEG_00018351 [Phytophthora megakarya]|uniref:Retrotransposon gag domain-containing protein n=1 Tax=Phytophthora megakarya TaxID=4795 RepID=A0A225VUJ2_9STRA|nr:hypothetical protein PHMEG_00018351 [Phytophthora megakarya]